MSQHDEANLLHLCPRVTPGVNLGALDLEPRQAFILSRLDGFTTTRQLSDMLNIPLTELLPALVQLGELGALMWPDDAPVRAVASASPPVGRRSAADIHREAHAMAVKHPALQEACDLSEDDRVRILTMDVAVGELTYWDILGVDPRTSPADLKKAYFQASKEFHSDRYFGKTLGSFKARLDRIFRAVKLAYETLADPDNRAAYLKAQPLSMAPNSPDADPSEKERLERLEQHRQAILAARQRRGFGRKPFGKR